MPFPEPSGGLELSEVVAVNNTVWRLDDGSTPDYIEIRNTGSATVSLDGLLLTDEAFKERFDGYSFPADASLGPGEYTVVACDGGAIGRPGFAPFKIDSDREQIALARRTESGLAAVVDMVQVRKLGDDEALFRAGKKGDWWTGIPTRGLENTPPGRLEIRQFDSRRVTLLVPVGTEGTAVLEATADFESGLERGFPVASRWCGAGGGVADSRTDVLQIAPGQVVLEPQVRKAITDCVVGGTRRRGYRGRTLGVRAG